MTSTTHPGAYLRRSFVDKDSPGDISREAQRETVRKLAAADGHNGDLVEYDDWGVSADIAKSAKRTAYVRLLADMEAGRVSAVYAFDVDRLYRDPRDLIRLQDAAQAHRVTITTTSGRLAIGEGDDPASEGFAFIGAVFGRMELQKAKKRARAAQGARQARGDQFGRPPYGYRMVRSGNDRVIFEPDPEQSIEPLLAAFLEAGSFSGAAKLLNERGVPTKRGATWAGNTVNRILRRERPGVAPRGRVHARVAARGSHRFSRLLRCPCGQLMTPRVTTHTTKYGHYGPYVGYQCHRGRYDPRHPRPYMVNEPSILEWAKAEAAHLEVPGGWLERATDDRRRIELETERERLGDKLLARVWSSERIAARADEIDLELSTLAQANAIDEIPQAVDWSWEPQAVNAVLRAMWDHIELDANMRPTEAVWRVPEWRR